MKHAVIVAHPNPDSFNLAMAHAYETAAKALGHEVLMRDLYSIGFDPRLGADEIPGSTGFNPRPDAQAERAMLADADVFVFVYPVWFNTPPAILKGYLERVFGTGFGFSTGAQGMQPLLKGKLMVSLSSSGAPQAWMSQTGAWTALRKLFDEHFASVTGLSVIEHLHFGEIVPGITSEAVGACLDQVGEAVRRNFGPPTN
ncbi:MAG: NAD(P)H-dependent oxidoreductase [Caulobacteraceae bacterium]|nr:NAD(P)H-dependent oxidoreductase [Caulobacteraceae bacterium]